MTIVTSRAQRRQLERDNAKLPVALQLVPPELWPMNARSVHRLRVWRGRNELVQEFSEDNPLVLVRLSINTTHLTGERWKDGLTWDRLQAIKSEIGYGEHDAVEIYPKDVDVVNVANMRHLWVLRSLIPFAWRKG